MGPVLSILGVLGPGVVGAVYIYTNHGGGRTSNNNVADQGNITAAINTTSCEYEASDQFAGNHNKTTLTQSAFGGATNVDIRHGTVNVVAGSQHFIYAKDADIERRDFANWLSPLNFKSIQIEIFQSRQDGTGQWMLDSEEFKSWCDGSEILWCRGIPGAGKTVLASIIVNHLQTFFQGQNVAIACVYCNHDKQHQQTVLNFVSSLLRQLVQDHYPAYEYVKSLYKCYLDQEIRPTCQKFLEALRLTMEGFKKVFVVVDALDECSNETRAEFLIALRNLPSTVSLLVTSRDLPPDFQGVRQLDIRANDRDVQHYIQGRLHLTDLKIHVNREPTLGGDIVKAITGNIDGMFLMARLHMDTLATTTTTGREVREALSNLPRDTSDIYDKTMERVDGQPVAYRKLARLAFIWIICAYRQLSFEELQHAIAISSHLEMTELDSSALVDETILTKACAGLVVVDRSGTVHLAHYTAQEYFERKGATRFPDAQATITKACLAYLSLDIFQRNYTDEEIYLLVRYNGLLGYAARHWGDHARSEVVMDEASKVMALRLLQDARKRVLSPYRWILDDGDTRGFSCMHFTAFFGLDKIVSHQLEIEVNGNLQDQFGRTPLLVAIEYERIEVARVLIAQPNIHVNSRDVYERTPLSFTAERGTEVVVEMLLSRDDINVNSKHTHGNAPLSLAAKNGHVALLRMLLVRDDIDVNSQNIYGRTPLSFAAENGNKAVVQELLARDDIDVNLKDSNGRTPLSFAAENRSEALVRQRPAGDDIDVNSKHKHANAAFSFVAGKGHVMVLRMLLERDDIDVNSQTIYGRTPLSLAAANGSKAVVRQLLAKDEIDVNMKDGDGRTPLSFAAERGSEEVVRLLLAHDEIDVNMKDAYGRAPLSFAAQRGSEEVVRQLLARDEIDVNMKDADGRTPLSFSAQSGSEEVVRLLLACNAIDVNTKANGRTPLSFAAQKGFEKVVRLLLTCSDIEADSKDIDGRTPLSFAAKTRSEKVVRQLLARDDIDVNSEDWNGQTPLSLAAENGFEEVVRQLLTRDDINVNSKDSHGQTPLSLAAENGFEGVVWQLIVRDDIDVNSEHRYGNTPLLFATEKRHVAVLRVLLARDDIDVNSQTIHGETPLSFAAANGSKAMVQQLLASGEIDVNAKDADGRTPLSFAAQRGSEEVVRLLLARDEIDVNTKDAKGRVPLSFASQRGSEEVVRLLLARDDIEVESKDINGQTPLSFASSEEVVRLLLARDDSKWN